MDAAQTQELLAALKERFARNMARHERIDWADVEARLMSSPAKLASVAQMEETGGEPDVIGQDPATGAFLFCDCAPESPAGRRSLCFDLAALNARKENKPKGDAQSAATAMGIDILRGSSISALRRFCAVVTACLSVCPGWARPCSSIRLQRSWA